MGRIVGIDLGTTTSEIAYIKNGKPEIIKNAIKDKKGLKLMERTTMLKRVVNKLRDIINTFNWE